MRAYTRTVRRDGYLRFKGLWYWCPALRNHAGRKVIVRPLADSIAVDISTTALVTICISEAYATKGDATA